MCWVKPEVNSEGCSGLITINQDDFKLLLGSQMAELFRK